jgi:SAM-dependent methyltransferase
MLVELLRLYSELIYFQFQHTNHSDYLKQWESFWSNVRLTGPQGQVVWDSDPSLAGAGDLRRFKRHMNPDLPLVDVGCGNGRQTRFLKQHFARVIGIDVSPSAISKAQQESRCVGNLEFRVLDATNRKEIAAFHNDLGDVNVYTRGVMHVMQKRDRARMAANLRVMLGNRGCLYQIEVSPRAIKQFVSLSGKSRLDLLKHARNIARHRIRSAGFDLATSGIYSPEDWNIIEHGQDAIHTIPLAGGVHASIPANYVLLRPRLDRPA